MTSKRIDRLRFRIAVGFTACLMIWPLVHMMLVSFLGVNATKLAGWGMYCVVKPRDIGITVIFLEQHGESVEQLDLGTVAGRTRIVRIDNGEVLELGSLQEISPEVAKAVEYVQVFRTGITIHRLVKHVKSAMEKMPTEPVLVLVSEQRISPLGHRSFIDITKYRSRGDLTEFMGSYRSDTATTADILAVTKTDPGEETGIAPRSLAKGEDEM